jgi:hypothetical protein
VRAARNLTVAAMLVACTSSGSPLDAPVEGARSVTDWVAEDPIEVGPFGRGAESAEAILELVREMDGGMWAVTPEHTIVGLLDDEDDGSVVGYVRTTLPASDHPLRGVDSRLDMRNQDGAWQLVGMERRYHCDAETATEFCQ